MIVGLGKTGLSCARYLHARGEDFMIVDSRQNPPGLAEVEHIFPALRVELGEFQESTLLNARRLIVSPGVSLEERAIAAARMQGIPVTGDIDLFSQVVKAPVVAVTGSNGKSTVVTIVAGICQRAGIDFALGGNLEAEGARPALDLLEGHERELYILELSSFQLETTSNLGAEVVTILNVSEDHMDRHENLQAYLQAKRQIFNGARKIVINRDSEFSMPPDPGGAQIYQYGLQEPGAGEFGVRIREGEQWLAYGTRNLFRASELKVIGQHNVSNMLAAMTIGKSLDIDLQPIVEGARNFAGLPHRCQWITRIDDVDYYNDSKATNVGAAAAAITGLGKKIPGRVVLIAGGVGKGADFTPLRNTVLQHVSVVILIGSAAAELAAQLEGAATIYHAHNLKEAVSEARKQAQPGDAVLLSPACASFDMFEDFKHRGQVFTELVEELL